MQSRVNSQTFVWLVNNNYGGAPQKWSTGELPFIHGAPPLNAVFPTNGSYSSAN